MKKLIPRDLIEWGQATKKFPMPEGMVRQIIQTLHIARRQ